MSDNCELELDKNYLELITCMDAGTISTSLYSKEESTTKHGSDRETGQSQLVSSSKKRTPAWK